MNDRILNGMENQKSAEEQESKSINIGELEKGINRINAIDQEIKKVLARIDELKSQREPIAGEMDALAISKEEFDKKYSTDLALLEGRLKAINNEELPLNNQKSELKEEKSKIATAVKKVAQSIIEQVGIEEKTDTGTDMGIEIPKEPAVDNKIVKDTVETPEEEAAEVITKSLKPENYKHID